MYTFVYRSLLWCQVTLLSLDAQDKVDQRNWVSMRLHLGLHFTENKTYCIYRHISLVIWVSAVHHVMFVFINAIVQLVSSTWLALSMGLHLRKASQKSITTKYFGAIFVKHNHLEREALHIWLSWYFVCLNAPFRSREDTPVSCLHVYVSLISVMLPMLCQCGSFKLSVLNA